MCVSCLLILWVSVGASTRLAVSRSTDGWIAEEAGGTQLAVLALSVMGAALKGDARCINRGVRLGPSYSGPAPYRADAGLGVAGVRVAVAVAELAVTQI